MSTIFSKLINLAGNIVGVLGPANGGTGVANNAASTVTVSGNFGTTLTVTGTTALTLPTSGIVATAQNGSVSSTFTFNGSGSPGTSSSVAIRYQRIGDYVTFHIPQVTATTGTSSSAFTANTAVDTWARPVSSNQAYFPASPRNNGATNSVMSRVSMTNTGFITILRDYSATAWTDAASAGVNSDVNFTMYVGTGS